MLFLLLTVGYSSEDNLQILEQSGLEYVVGAKLKTQARVIKEQILSPDHYQELNEDTSYLTIDLEGKRKLVVSYSKKRAHKDQHDRQKEIDKLKKKLNRSRKPKEFISASGYKRFLTVSDHERVEINEAAIEKATQWDGLHGVADSDNKCDTCGCQARGSQLLTVVRFFSPKTKTYHYELSAVD